MNNDMILKRIDELLNDIANLRRDILDNNAAAAVDGGACSAPIVYKVPCPHTNVWLGGGMMTCMDCQETIAYA